MPKDGIVNNNFSTLKNLALLREGRRLRESSYDRSGGNNDFFRIDPGQVCRVADRKGQSDDFQASQSRGSASRNWLGRYPS